MRMQMRVEHVKLRMMTTEEYDSAMSAADPTKKSELGVPET